MRWRQGTDWHDQAHRPRARNRYARYACRYRSFREDTVMFDLTGKTALVTGATVGIGGAIAKAVHRQGATVVISGTRAEALESLKNELGERVHVVPCNLADMVSVEALPKTAEAAAGAPIDILVNNAGITRDNLF